MLKALRKKLAVRFLPIIGVRVHQLLVMTMRFSYVNMDYYMSKNTIRKPLISTFWHGRLSMMPFIRYQGNDTTALVSQHRDGEMVSRAFTTLGIKTVRGSSTRGWVGGIKGLLKAIKAGSDIAITPDGPRGPRYKAEAGAVKLASKTGLQIVPITFGASKKKLLGAGMPSPFPAPSHV
jgi:hypothetical protein